MSLTLNNKTNYHEKSAAGAAGRLGRQETWVGLLWHHYRLFNNLLAAGVCVLGCGPYSFTK